MELYGNTLVEVLWLEDLYTTYKDHRRLTVFVNKGCKCVVCGRVGKLLLVTEQKPTKPGRPGKRHVDLYTSDFILMTVDHIVPRAECKKLGWTRQECEALSNKQPMCRPCNLIKDNKQLTIAELRELQHLEV